MRHRNFGSTSRRQLNGTFNRSISVFAVIKGSMPLPLLQMVRRFLNMTIRNTLPSMRRISSVTNKNQRVNKRQAIQEINTVKQLPKYTNELVTQGKISYINLVTSWSAIAKLSQQRIFMSRAWYALSPSDTLRERARYANVITIWQRQYLILDGEHSPTSQPTNQNVKAQSWLR